MATKLHRNTTYDELEVGAAAKIERICRAEDLVLFAHASGNLNPLMLPSHDSLESRHAIAPSLWVGSLVSAVLGNLLPGAGTLYLSQNFRFGARVRCGDWLAIEVHCTEKRERPVALFDVRVTKSDGSMACEGVAEVAAPLESVETPSEELPPLLLGRHENFDRLIQRASGLPPLATAVICPDDQNSLGGAVLSAEHGLIAPILVGARTGIQRAADALGLDLSAYRIVEAGDAHEACVRAVELVVRGEAQALMKGNVHSDALLAAVLKKDGGLRGTRRISHAFVMDAPALDRLLFVSDAAVNIAPDLTTKVDIVQNAIDLARGCGVETPKVGVLSAVETVNPAIPSTLDAAILSKMADRGQISGGIVDGPLAMDNAVDIGAAHTKGISSLVAGRADILIAPNLEAGNMLAKELTFVAHAKAAGIVLGAKAPIMLTSRADDDRARLGSSALAQLYQYWRKTRKARGSPEPLPQAAE
ncbi:MAG TPA: bifunctional enoyl-CoA hydratase/phosphate acetyltransferase [Methylocystis sp.]|nr:bifunctional enoyl-CoA hydratase/phosphate acetyltransferase [Methylocystis sp.]